MRFYTRRHRFYCGVDLHASTMYLCVMDDELNILLHRNVPARAVPFLKAIAPYQEDLVVGAECVFSWYWLADLCSEAGIEFTLGHALYMRAIHGAKAKNDRIDSQKIASLLVGRNFPLSYVYPPAMRSTRDLLRRRNHQVQKRAELLAHIENTRSQYNLPEFEKRLNRKASRSQVAERFGDASARKSVEVDLVLIDYYDQVIADLELYILQAAKEHDPQNLALLRTIPGVGKILSLVMLYEIHIIERFPGVGDFLSYSRVVRCKKVSVGKITGTSGKKIGNPHLKWAFSEATCLFLRNNPPAQKYLARLERRHPKGMALSILGQKIARAVYYMLKRRRAFDITLFFKNKISWPNSPAPDGKTTADCDHIPRAASPKAQRERDAAGAAPPPAGLGAAPALALRAPPRSCRTSKAAPGKIPQTERRRKRTKR